MTRNISNAFWRSCVAVAALLVVSQQAGAQPLKGDWSMLNFNAEGQRYNPYETALTKKSVKSLQLAWKLDINPQARSSASSPAVVGGVLYVGSSDGNFYARDAVTGKKLWTVKLHGIGIVDTPAVVDGIVYIPEITQPGSNLRALDAATGATLWTAKFKEITLGSPIVSHGLVFQDTMREQLNALVARSGKKLWTTDILGGNESSGAPAVANGIVYALSAYGLNAYTASTGALLWHVDGIDSLTTESSPAVTDGKVFFNTTGDVRAYDAANGASEWVAALGPNPSGSIAVTNSRVYALDTAGVIWNYDGNTGFPTFAQGQIGQAASPTIANGVLYAGSYNSVNTYDVKSGALLWSAPLAASAQTSPVVANGMVYIVAGSLYAFALKD